MEIRTKLIRNSDSHDSLIEIRTSNPFNQADSPYLTVNISHSTKASLIQTPPPSNLPLCERLTFETHAHLNVFTQHPIAPSTANYDSSAQAPIPDHQQIPSFLCTAPTPSTSTSTCSYSNSVYPAHKCAPPGSNRPPPRPHLTTRPLTDTHH